MIENNELWDAYCAEVPAKRRSPQGAMAFAFDKLVGAPAQCAPNRDLLQRLRDYLMVNIRPGNDLAPKYIREIDAALTSTVRCPTCHHTDEEYAAGDLTCVDPWHGDDHLRAKASTDGGAK